MDCLRERIYAPAYAMDEETKINNQKELKEIIHPISSTSCFIRTTTMTKRLKPQP
jgi:hypothetical protein